MTNNQPFDINQVELLEDFIKISTANTDRLDRIEAVVEKIEAAVEKNAQSIDLLQQDIKNNVANTDRLDRIEAAVERNVQSIDLLQQDIRRWDERYFQLSRDNISISKGIILATSSVVIISSLAPSLKLLISSFLEIFGIAPQP